MLTYYDRLNAIPDAELRIGLERLARALKASREIQGITLRVMSDLTAIFCEKRLSPTHISGIENSHYRKPQEDTLFRIIPFVFSVDYFNCVGNDVVGLPIFKYRAEDYSGDKLIKLKVMSKFKPNPDNTQFLPKISQLPDQDYRCKDLKDILTILSCESRQIVTRSDQMYTPSLVRSLAS